LRGGAFHLTMETLLAAPEREDLPERVRRAVAEFLEMVDDVHAACREPCLERTCPERSRRSRRESRTARDRSLPALLDYVLRRTGYAAWLRKAGNGNGNGSANNSDETALLDLPAGKEAAAVHNLRLMLEGYRGEDSLAQFLQDVEEMQALRHLLATMPYQAQVSQETITFLAAGGTDTDVHAAGRVIAFDMARLRRERSAERCPSRSPSLRWAVGKGRQSATACARNLR